MRQHLRTMIPLRLAGAILACLRGFYIFGTLQSWALGRSASMLLVGSLYVLPITVVPFLGLPSRTVLRYVAALLSLTFLVAYLWLHLEAYWIVRPAINQRHPIYAQRSWPFASASVSYSPEHGVHWND